MTANKNEPDKKPAGSASAQASARPHATLDLKATDVTPPAPAAKDEAEAKGKPGVAETPDKAKAASGASTPAAGPAAASNASAKPTAASPASTAAAAKAQKPGAGGASSGSAPRGYGGFFTHMAAGLVGGVIALLAADILAGQFGFVTTDQPDQTAVIEQRLNALEIARNTQHNLPADVTARLDAAEAKLGKLEQLDANLDGVSKKQSDFDKELNSLSSKLRSEDGGGETGARLAKLEEQLSLLSSAAPNGAQSGQLPQLAAITGKLADLEQTVTNQLDAMRKNVAQEIDARLTAADEASQAARSGTQRIDRELSTLKAETAEISAGLVAMKTDNDRIAAALRTTQEDMKRLKADVDTRLASVAKPEDVSSAVAPLTSKLSALQEDVQGVIKSEGDRRTTAERIVLSLELANLKRAIDRGKPYAAELAQTRKIAGNVVDLAPLERFALDGVPTATELRQEFQPVAFKIIDAGQQPADASIVDRLLAGAKSVVRVRKTAQSPDDKSVEAIVARMETALKEDRFADVMTEAKTLPPSSQDAAKDFLAKVEAREAVDRALTSIETQLKSSLAAAPSDADGKSAQ